MKLTETNQHNAVNNSLQYDSVYTNSKQLINSKLIDNGTKLIQHKTLSPKHNPQKQILNWNP